jgi:hypothetical protein
MIRGLQVSVSLISLAAISTGCGYALAHQQLPQEYPQTVYREINRHSFQGNLPDVPVTWGYLDKRLSQTNSYSGRATDIQIDRTTVNSEELLKEALRHEACHVAVGPDLLRTTQAVDGKLWQTCMKRYR